MLAPPCGAYGDAPELRTLRAAMTAALNAKTRRLLIHGAILVGLIFGAYVLFVAAPAKGTLGIDAMAYWRIDLADPYGNAPHDAAWGVLGHFFPYAPPIALLFAPFAGLSWPAFAALWYAMLIGALVWLGRRDVLILAAFPPVALNLSDGNIHLVLAAAMVLGFRYPAAWSLLLLTKVTPGIGLLWFAARREWRSLAIALGATAAIVLVTALFLPTQWLAWLHMLRESVGVPAPWPALPIPLWLRLPVAAVVVVWGARRNARWTVPVAATLALPALWLGGLAMLVACWPLRSSTRRREASRPTRIGARGLIPRPC